MTFRQRFLYYLFGFGLGIVLTIFLFRNRGCEWTPGNRVLDQINTSQLLITDSVRCILKANGLDENSVFEVLKTGKVDFSESRTQDQPKMYVIEEIHSKKLLMFLVRNDSVSIVHGVYKGKTGDCKDFGANQEKILNMPEKTIKQILKANELSAADSVFASIRSAGIKEADLYNIIQTSTIEFDKSLPTNKPHPIYFVKNKGYRFKLEMAEKKTRILEFGKE